MSVGRSDGSDRSGQPAGQRPPPLQAEPMLRVLAEHGVDFVIIGGFALSAHGVIRGTKDIDIVPDPRSKNIGRLAAAARAQRGSNARRGLRSRRARAGTGRRWPVARRELGPAHPLGAPRHHARRSRGKSYDALRVAAVERDVPGAGSFWFSGLDDLIAMKVAAGRPQDELDITSLQRARSPRGA
ncbi:MAG: hypothetical protein V7607_5879 [Solirubrobacteraceae bacterium]